MTMTGRIQPGIPLATPFQFSEEFSSTQRNASGPQALCGINVMIDSPLIGWQVRPLMELAPLECKFRSRKQLKWGTPVTCAFCHPDGDETRTVNGRVHWSRLVKDSWHTGVFLDEPVEERFIEALGCARRSSLRYEIQWPANIEFEDGNEKLDVVVQDYDIRGLSVSGVLPHPIGGRFNIYARQQTVPEPIASGTVLWQQPWGDNETIIGARASGRELSWFFAIRQDVTSEPLPRSDA